MRIHGEDFRRTRTAKVSKSDYMVCSSKGSELAAAYVYDGADSTHNQAPSNEVCATDLSVGEQAVFGRQATRAAALTLCELDTVLSLPDQ